MRSELRQALIFGLTIAVALGKNPACSALALAVCFAAHLLDKYLHISILDPTRRELASIKAELTKQSERLAKIDLKSAFGERK